jgi:hypothetical protein
MTGVDVSIVVPVTSVRADVRELVSALTSELDRLEKRWECILVFDGVQGAAWEAGLALQAQTGGRVKTIAMHRPFGESVCLASAFEHAAGELVLTAPQYVQTDPRCLATLFRAVDEGADFVATRRHPRIDPWLNRVQSAAFNVVMRRIVGAQFRDLNSTLRLIRREVLEQVTIYGDMYRYLPAIAWRAGFRVVEVPVRHVAEWGKVGIYGPGVYVRRLLDVIGVTFLTRFTHKPLRFFGAFGGSLMLAGGLLSTIMFAQWLFQSDKGLYQRPLFQIGVLGFILGVQVIGFGLVGEIIVYTQARNVREYRIERLVETRGRDEEGAA